MFSTRSGAILKELRGGERPEVLAMAAGVSVASVYKYEAGQIPQRRIQLKIAKHYGKTVGEIFGQDNQAVGQ